MIPSPSSGPLPRVPDCTTDPLWEQFWDVLELYFFCWDSALVKTQCQAPGCQTVLQIRCGNSSDVLHRSCQQVALQCTVATIFCVTLIWCRRGSYAGKRLAHVQEELPAAIHLRVYFLRRSTLSQPDCKITGNPLQLCCVKHQGQIYITYLPVDIRSSNAWSYQIQYNSPTQSFNLWSSWKKGRWSHPEIEDF